MTPETAAFLDALADLEEALERNVALADRMRERITYLRRECAAERPLAEVAMAEEPPLVVQLLTESANILHTYGTRVRRTEARALHREGVTMDVIARLFGVSRQRVSALLRDGSSDPGD